MQERSYSARLSRVNADDLPISLLDTIKVEMSPRQRHVMHVIDEEDYEPVKTKVRFELGLQGNDPSEDYLDEGVLALKQYYAICFLDNNAHAISFTLDSFWHAHILHTVAYHCFCKKLGIGYMHHAPNDPANTEETAALRVLYDHTQRVFAECFSWISPMFNPRGHEDRLLLCSHYTQNGFVCDGDIALPRLPEVEAAESYFVRTRRIPRQ